MNEYWKGRPMNFRHTDKPKNKNAKAWQPGDHDPDRPTSSRARQGVVVRLADFTSAQERGFPNIEMTSVSQEHEPPRKRVGDR